MQLSSLNRVLDSRTMSKIFSKESDSSIVAISTQKITGPKDSVKALADYEYNQGAPEGYSVKTEIVDYNTFNPTISKDNSSKSSKQSKMLFTLDKYFKDGDDEVTLSENFTGPDAKTIETMVRHELQLIRPTKKAKELVQKYNIHFDIRLPNRLSLYHKRLTRQEDGVNFIEKYDSEDIQTSLSATRDDLKLDEYLPDDQNLQPELIRLEINQSNKDNLFKAGDLFLQYTCNRKLDDSPIKSISKETKLGTEGIAKEKFKDYAKEFFNRAKDLCNTTLNNDELYKNLHDLACTIKRRSISTKM